MSNSRIRKKRGRRIWMYRTFKNENGERWALREIPNNAKFRHMNFWHIVDDTCLLFTFKQNKLYNRKTIWTEDMIRKLEDDLKSPNPSVKILRCAYNNQVLFVSDDYAITGPLPNTPREPKKPDGLERHLEEKKRHFEKQERRLTRLAIEEIKGNEPAPYILYGKHDNVDKEFAWNLTPDKPKRQGISIGDRVLVWTKRGFREVTVTRIEEADGTVKPTARVKKKL